MAGVTVNLRDVEGALLRSTETDEDGYYDSACGLCTLDDVQLSGAINHTSTFEAGADGWALPVSSNAVGDWSDLRALSTLPPPLTACACDLQDSVLVFALPGGGQPASINNVAVSPWIDLQRHGDTGRPGRVIEFAAFNDQPLLTRGQRLMVQYACTTVEGARIDVSYFINTEQPDPAALEFFAARGVAVRLPGEARTLTWTLKGARRPKFVVARKQGRYWNCVSEIWTPKN